MISLRHHAISLAAVFIALAVGVVLGARCCPDTLLSGLRGEAGSQKQITALSDQRNALNEKLSAASDFDTQMSGRMVRDALAGKSVVLFRTPDADNDDVEGDGAPGRPVRRHADRNHRVDSGVRRRQLGGETPLSGELPIVPAGAQLSTTLVDQGSQAGDLLGIALLINRDPAVLPADDTQRDTVLAALRDTGFLTYEGDRIGAANTAVVITGGALGDNAGNQAPRWPFRRRTGPARAGHGARGPWGRRRRHRGHRHLRGGWPGRMPGWLTR